MPGQSPSPSEYETSINSLTQNVQEKAFPEGASRPKRAQAPPPPPPLTASPSQAYADMGVAESYAGEPPIKRAPPAPSFTSTPDVAQGYPGTPSAPDTQEETDATERNPALDDPVLKKFAMMQKMNLPQGAIEQAMIRASLDPSLLFGASAMTRLNETSTPLVIPQRQSTQQLEAPTPAKPTSVMEELLQGRTLRKVEAPSEETKSPGGGGGSQNELMQGILEGRGRLKKVEQDVEQEKKKPTSSALDGGGVASILARRIAIIGDKGSDTESEDGSDWDEDA
jgi:hypothetical protein